MESQRDKSWKKNVFMELWGGRGRGEWREGRKARRKTSEILEKNIKEIYNKTFHN